MRTKLIAEVSLHYPTTSKTLLDKLQSMDEISWTEFFDRYRHVIVSLGRLKGLQDTECDDLVQEVMVFFVKRSKTFVYHEELARFRTYLGKVIAGKIVDILRKRQPFTPVPPTIEDENSLPPDAILEEALKWEWRTLLLEEALRSLQNRVEPVTFMAFDFHVRHHLPVQEVMARLGISANQVYLAKSRCRKLLREIISDYQAQDPTLELECHDL